MASQSAIVVLVLVLIAAVSASYWHSHKEKYGYNPYDDPGTKRYGLFDYPFRYNPQLVSGHETVMFPNLFHGI